MTLDELVERVVDLTLQYQGSGIGGPHDAIRDEVQEYLATNPGIQDEHRALQEAGRKVIEAWKKGAFQTSKALRQLAELLPEKPEVWP